MTDSTRTRVINWPPGPFLTFSDPDEPDKRPSVAPKLDITLDKEWEDELADEEEAEPEPAAAAAPVAEPKDAKAPEPETTTDVDKTSGEDTDEDKADEDEDEDAKPFWSRFAKAPAAPAEAPAAPAPPAAAPAPAHPAVERVVREVQLIKSGDKHAKRRLAALKYAIGAGLGWQLAFSDRADTALTYIYNHPADMLCYSAAAASAYGLWKLTGRLQPWLQPTFEAIGRLFDGIGTVLHPLPLIGPVYDMLTKLYGATFTTYTPMRAFLALTGGWFAYPWGFVAIGYAQAHGLDAATIADATTKALGIGATGLSWYAIDRRAHRYATHIPGHAFHSIACTITATVGLATLGFSAL